MKTLLRLIGRVVGAVPRVGQHSAERRDGGKCRSAPIARPREFDVLEGRELLSGMNDFDCGQVEYINGQFTCEEVPRETPIFPGTPQNPGGIDWGTLPGWTPDPDPSPSPWPEDPWTPDCWPGPENNWCFIGLPYDPPGYSPEPPVDSSPGHGSDRSDHKGAKHSGKHFKHAPDDHPFDGNGHGSGKHKHGKNGFDGSGLGKNLRGKHRVLDQHVANDWTLPSDLPGATPTPLEQYQQQIDQLIQQQIDRFQGFPQPFLPW